MLGVINIVLITVMAFSEFGWRVAQFGGNLNNGSNAGLLYSNFNNDSGNDNPNIGTHLSILFFVQKAITSPLGEKHKYTSSAGRENRTLCVVDAKYMKRYNNLYQKVYDKDNIRKAYYNARKGKAHYPEVKEINKNVDKYIDELHFLLKEKRFVNGEYEVFTKITGGKERKIYKLPFYPDRVVHHCIIQVMKPIWMEVFIRDTYATIPGRGIHDGAKRVKEAVKGKDSAYCFKGDIKKFYPSVNHDILKSIISKKVKDEDMIALFNKIIDSAPGIPIGNYVSQWLGNLYLAYFDHFVKEVIKVKHYFRYADDIVLIADNKEELAICRDKIMDYLDNELLLEVKSNHQIFPIAVRGIDFLGYRFYPSHTLVRKNIVKAFKQKKKNGKATKQSQPSYYGWFKHADTHNLMKKYFYEAV